MHWDLMSENVNFVFMPRYYKSIENITIEPDLVYQGYNQNIRWALHTCRLRCASFVHALSWVYAILQDDQGEESRCVGGES